MESYFRMVNNGLAELIRPVSQYERIRDRALRLINRPSDYLIGTYCGFRLINRIWNTIRKPQWVPIK
jgi:hypothetical protein